MKLAAGQIHGIIIGKLQMPSLLCVQKRLGEGHMVYFTERCVCAFLGLTKVAISETLTTVQGGLGWTDIFVLDVFERVLRLGRRTGVSYPLCSRCLPASPGSGGSSGGRGSDRVVLVLWSFTL